MSILSLKRSTPVAFITPLTPSGVLYAHSVAVLVVVVFNVEVADSSEVSAISTRPCSLIVSMRAGMTFYIEISHFP